MPRVAIMILVGGALVPSVANVLSDFIPLIQILPIALVGIVFIVVALRYSPFTVTASVANATTGITLIESSPLKQNWNCKNCGGPNIEQVKCQYCGMVKE